jgi:hypothetical protein
LTYTVILIPLDAVDFTLNATNCTIVVDPAIAVPGDDRTGGIVGQVVQNVEATISNGYALNTIDGGAYSAGGIVGSAEIN